MYVCMMCCVMYAFVPVFVCLCELVVGFVFVLACCVIVEAQC